MNKLSKTTLVTIFVIAMAVGSVLWANHQYHKYFVKTDGQKLVRSECKITSRDFEIILADGSETVPLVRKSDGIIIFEDGDMTARGISIGDDEEYLLDAYSGGENTMNIVDLYPLKIYEFTTELKKESDKSKGLYLFVRNGIVEKIEILDEKQRNYSKEIWDYFGNDFPIQFVIPGLDKDIRETVLYIGLEDLSDDLLVEMWNKYSEASEKSEISVFGDRIKIFNKGAPTDDYYILNAVWHNREWCCKVRHYTSSEDNIYIVGIESGVRYEIESSENSNQASVKIPPGVKILQIDPGAYDNELQYAEDAAGVDFDTFEEAQEFYHNYQ